MRSGFIVILSIATTVLWAQNYSQKKYKIEHGLPTDLIKGISEDSLGNLWIATDEGFVRYNAAKFEIYRYATHSNYTKGFYRTRNGRLLAFGDLDVFELKTAGDSTEFHSLIPVSWIANDSSLSYPKLFYEDVRGGLWVSESQAVVRLEGDRLRRYEFTLEDRTPQFLRSFSFFEDGNHDFYAVSVAGNVFRYDRQLDRFLKGERKFPSQVEFVGVLNGHLVVGALNGLYAAAPTGHGKFGELRLMSAIRLVSYVAALPNGNYFVATRGTDHFLVDSTFSNKRLAVTGVDNINHVYVSREHDIWLSTNEGMLFMQEAAFQGPNGKLTGFIECIAEDVRGSTLYYATSETLHALNIKTREDKTVISNIAGGYFRSLVSTKKGLWAANAFRVILIQDNKIVKTFDFSDQRMFVTLLSKDFEENVWLTIPGRREVLMIDQDLHLHAFEIPFGKDGFINEVKDGGDGIYVASNGADYLFYKAYNDTVFHNISLPVELNRGEEMNTFGLFVNGKSVWLATSVGLLKYDHKTVERVDIGEGYNAMPVRSIYPNEKKGFLLATPKELLYYNVELGDCNLFSSSMHLSGLTVNARSLMISRDKRVWLGTSRGMFASSHRITDEKKTPQPRLAYVNVNDRKTLNTTHAAVFPYNALLSLGVTSVTFPEDERVFEFRYSEDQPWRRLRGTAIDIITSHPGGQSIQIRARKTGSFDWSKVTHIQFYVLRPFWMTIWFYMLVALSIFGIIALTVVIVRAFGAKQKLSLEKIVADRTAQLDAANQELEAFSYSVSHDLRAPLRAVIGFSHVLEEDYAARLGEDGRKTIDSLKRNATKMNQLIDDLLRFARAFHQGLEKNAVNLNDQVREIVAGLHESAYQQTVVNIQPLPTVIADGRLIAQVWSNLISNAMKYSSRAALPQVDIAYEEKQGEFIFCVRDNGVGFNNQYAKKLFDVFQRLHAEHEFPGIGIGLALVRRIVTRHGGRIWAEGKINEGAAFYFTLPK